MIILDSPPEFADPGSIESYAEKPQIFGVIRAKLVRQSSNSIISPGEWFSQPNQIYTAPLDEALITEEIGLLAHPIANRRMLDQLNPCCYHQRKTSTFCSTQVSQVKLAGNCRSQRIGNGRRRIPNRGT